MRTHSPLAKVKASSAAHAVCGIIVGYLTSIVLPNFVFYTTKSNTFIDTFWILASSVLVAVAFAAIPWASLHRNHSSRDVCLIGFKSILIALLPAATIGILFAQLHSNYFKSIERFGNFFTLIGPAYFFIVLCAMTSFLIFMFQHKTISTISQGEQTASSNH
jgi:hypothetical protein